MNRNIVAIGGGRIMAPHISKVQTLDIDQEIIRFSGKKKPSVLFIPTASEDNLEYVEAFKRLYSDNLNCKVDCLLLYKDRPSKRAISKKILDSDVIYVGGGNTLRMMRFWRKLGIDKLLAKARQNKTVLCGLSAGAICWFEYGNSDSRKFKDGVNKTLIRVKGLGYVNLLLCPHYDTEQHRQDSLKNMMQKQKGVSVALENGTAIQIKNDEYRIITSMARKNAWRIYWSKGEYFKEKLEKNSAFKPLEGMLTIST